MPGMGQLDVGGSAAMCRFCRPNQSTAARAGGLLDRISGGRLMRVDRTRWARRAWALRATVSYPCRGELNASAEACQKRVGHRVQHVGQMWGNVGHTNPTLLQYSNYARRPKTSRFSGQSTQDQYFPQADAMRLGYLRVLPGELFDFLRKEPTNQLTPGAERTATGRSAFWACVRRRSLRFG